MADFQQSKAEFDSIDARIVALSADREEEAQGTVERVGLEFTVLYGLDPVGRLTAGDALTIVKSLRK